VVALDFEAIVFDCAAGSAGVFEGFEEGFEGCVAVFEGADEGDGFAASAFAGGLDAEVVVGWGEVGGGAL